MKKTRVMVWAVVVSMAGGVACGSGSDDSETDSPSDTSNDPTATDTSSETDPVAANSDDSDSSAVSPSTAVEPSSPAGSQVEPDTNLPPTDDPSLQGSTPIAPGTPEVLAQGLWFPGRLALHEQDLYIANRARLGSTAARDELLRLPLQTPEAVPERVFEAVSIEGFAFLDNEIWIASREEAAFLAFDARTTLQTQSVFPPASPAYSVASNTQAAFLASARGTVQRQPAGGGQPEVLYVGELELLVPQWMRATSAAVFVTMEDYESEPGSIVSTLLRIDAQGAAAANTSNGLVLVDRGSRLAGFDFQGETVIFADYDNGTLERVPANGGETQTITQVGFPWAVAVDGDFAYVSIQPTDLCTTGTEGSVVRVNLTSGERVVLAQGLACPSMLLATSDALYWLNNGTAVLDNGTVHSYGDGSLMRLPR